VARGTARRIYAKLCRMLKEKGYSVEINQSSFILLYLLTKKCHFCGESFQEHTPKSVRVHGVGKNKVVRLTNVAIVHYRCNHPKEN